MTRSWRQGTYRLKQNDSPNSGLIALQSPLMAVIDSRDGTGVANVDIVKLGIEDLEQVEQIGSGGSARVYKAKQVALDRWVALKVINAAGNPEVARRFDRERKAMGRLSQHAGIAPVYSTGMTAQDEPYLIMPYYADGSLQERLEKGPLPWQEAVELITAAATTMAAAHDAGVVHLDLKPANILLSSDGSPRIADFGIAKLTSEKAETTAGSVFTPAYSAPETLLDGEASPAADVYGLTATLWALIAGHAPFRSQAGDSGLMAVVGRVINDPPEELGSDVPAAIRQVISQGLAKSPTDRFETAGDFADALASARAMADSSPQVTADTWVQATADSDPTSVSPDHRPAVGAAPGGTGVPGAPPGVVVNLGTATVPPSTATAAAVPSADIATDAMVAATPRTSFPRYDRGDTSRVADLVSRVPFSTFAGVGLALIVLAAAGIFMFTGPDESSGTTHLEVAGPGEDDPSTTVPGPVTTTGAEVNNTSPAPTPPSTLGTQATVRAPASSTTQPPPSTPTTPSTVPPSSTDTTEPTSTTVTSVTVPSTTSTTTSTTITEPPGPPNTPQSVSALVDKDDVTVRVSWDEPSGGSEVEGYTIFRDGVAITGAPLDPNVRQLEDKPGPGTYSYQVQAVNEHGKSALSSAITIEIPDPTATPPTDSA